MPTAAPFRLRKHADYQRVYQHGRKQFARNLGYFVLVRAAGSDAAARSETCGPRVGLAVPKALGKAHDRNRIKRRLRECVRQHVALMTTPVDVVIHPRRAVLTLEFNKLQDEVALVFRAAQAAAERAATAAERARAAATNGPSAIEAA